MANKSNIRSMRFSDDILAMIESQEGSTFTQKFENLVVKCCWGLPQREEELKGIQERIEQERKNLRHIQEMKRKFENNIRDMNWAMKNAARQINRVSEALEGIEA